MLFAAIILSFYGGGFATVPAYLRDLFGTFQVGAIHGRLLTAWSAAGVAGPLIVNRFLDTQGTPGELTADAYRGALFIMVGLLAVGFVANLLIRPVADRFHEPDDGDSVPDDVREARGATHDRPRRRRLGRGRHPAALRPGRDHQQGRRRCSPSDRRTRRPHRSAGRAL